MRFFKIFLFHPNSLAQLINPFYKIFSYKARFFLKFGQFITFIVMRIAGELIFICSTYLNKFIS
ncbi:MAG: hypothetical protein C0168_05650 [Candidatus Aminicenantes bacterium]|nr:MAG: hypothetical protein C0168_05650 [Candidatus Aminicenantes bacterium]